MIIASFRNFLKMVPILSQIYPLNITLYGTYNVTIIKKMDIK